MVAGMRVHADCNYRREKGPPVVSLTCSSRREEKGCEPSEMEGRSPVKEAVAARRNLKQEGSELIAAFRVRRGLFAKKEQKAGIKIPIPAHMSYKLHPAPPPFGNLTK